MKQGLPLFLIFLLNLRQPRNCGQLSHLRFLLPISLDASLHGDNKNANAIENKSFGFLFFAVLQDLSEGDQ